MGLLEFFSSDIGVDLGTANTLVYVKGKGILVRNPSVIAVDAENQSVIAVGEKAQRLGGRQPSNILVRYPLRDGVITDLDIAYKLLQQVLEQAQISRSLFPPRLIMAVPNGATTIEQRALQDIAEQAGAKEVFIIDEAIAAAIGAGLPIDKPLGNMIVDIGGGTTEVAVLSLCGVLSSQSLRVAGAQMDDVIYQSLKRDYDFWVGEQTAQSIKHQLGSAEFNSQWDNVKMEIGGCSLNSRLPKQLTLTGMEVREMLHKEVALIARTVQQTLEQTTPEIASDIYTNGLMLCGGGSLLKGLDEFICRETGVFVHVAPNPMDCVALGIGEILENRQRWERVWKHWKRQ
ncbi:rod shape-determining protein (plasmid) [Acaryochloris sp. CCMEE 5410]|nr:rod shape-determining protein [Acaryochloris sp. CCMEE 5410]